MKVTVLGVDRTDWVAGRRRHATGGLVSSTGLEA
jgi:hypothetical protein